MQTLEETIKASRSILFRNHRDQDGVRNHLSALAQSHLGPMPVEHINRNDVALLRDDIIAAGKSDGTVIHRLAKLSRVLNWAHDRGLRSAPAPTLKISRASHERDYEITPEVERQMSAALRKRGAHHAALFDFLLYTACRYSEATGLTWMDWHGDKVSFLKTKNGNPRTVPLFPPAQNALELQRETHPLDPGPFTWALQHYKFYNAWRPAKKEIGLADEEDFVPHSCRHTCITRLAREGMSMMMLQQWGGWKSLAMLNRYSHLQSAHDLGSAVKHYAIDRPK